MNPEAPIRTLSATAYTLPTDAPEADGTLAWQQTTLVLVEIEAAGHRGLGYTYSDQSCAALINHTLGKLLRGQDAFDPAACLGILRRHVRNLGRSGIAATAMSAIDVAIWDLKAKLLDLPLARLLGQVREQVPIYGSGGFTTYDNATLQAQLSGWVETNGCHAVKMKIGSEPSCDPARVTAARKAIGEAALFVDANGAYTRKQAQAFAAFCVDQGVTWFEEPVSSDDLPGLRALRDHTPSPIEIAAGEYAFDLDDISAMLQAGAVDVQQADVSRCGGISGFLAAGVLCDAFHTDLSGHCAPSLHMHVACAVPRLRHLEYFHDHVRIESMLFDGAAVARNGVITPDLTRPGLGLELKRSDAERYAA